jgi:RNA ligase
MKIDLTELRNRNKYINENALDDLIIWNYTPECQYSKAWDEYTTICRGLITDVEGNVIARPFRKFFNYGEESKENLPTEKPILYEKLDGSLGIQFYRGEDVCISTRGSFVSDQAIWATNWMKQRGLKKSDFLEGKTYLYEILYKENRIVVSYGDREELVLLAVIDNETGEEEPYICEIEGKRLNIPYIKHIEFENIEDIIEKTKSLDGNQEGFVFHWPAVNNHRVKIKGEEYVRLHRVITGFSNKSIWDALRTNADLSEMLERVPDEFYEWVKKTKSELFFRYLNIKLSVISAYKKISKLETRKEQAIEIMKSYKDISSCLFLMLDDKDISQQIWKMIRPVYERPFTKDIDEN